MSKIPVVYAFHSQGCAPVYSIRALEKMGHTTRRMTPDEYFAADPNDYDLFFFQDSGEGIDFRKASSAHLRKTSAWYWDSRFNRVQRNPGDDEMAKLVNDSGGWVFQAQTPDLHRCDNLGIRRQSWLPIPVDVDIWNCDPVEMKDIELSFIGNCYDGGRATALNYARDHCGLVWPGANSTFYEDAAKIYRRSWVVFHAPTFYNLPHDVTHERVDYDLTMRPYEALACGAPVVTPPLPDYAIAGFEEGNHIFIYHNLDEIPEAVRHAKFRALQPDSVQELRSFAVKNHSSTVRMADALQKLQREGVYRP